mmetsp:Transcript_98119/g.311194  ORF Transcript_98119/g.311194 Transcript_98119/m.311194 type:complete len:229 (+) Transcript_98119:380-1066(+)
MERDIARPHSGVIRRDGSLPCPRETRPPASIMRLASSSRSGLWMSVSCVTSQAELLVFRLAQTAMESPRKAQRKRIDPPRVPLPGSSNMRRVAVVPEFSALAPSSACMCMQTSRTEDSAAGTQPSGSCRRCSVMYFGNLSCTKCETSCPSGPWPSRTPSNRESQRARTKKSSWFGESGLWPRWLMRPTRWCMVLNSPSKFMRFAAKNGENLSAAVVSEPQIDRTAPGV